jgi:DNA repair protein SbcD/Mre11
MPPIRVLHFADLHIGMENYGRLDPATGTSSRARDFLDRLDEVVEFAANRHADAVIFSGDAFKTRDPEPTQQREFARRIKRLAEFAPVLLLVGNHDLPGAASKATSLDIYHVLDIPRVIVGYKPEGRLIETPSGPLYLAWMPYPSRNRLLADETYRGKSLPELEFALRDVAANLIADLAQDASRQTAPRILAGHFSVGGAVFGSERSVMLGNDVAVSKSTLADPVWDYVALGHIHKHQNLTEGEPGVPPVVYAGSLERIDFGEEKEPKGFCWVEVERGSANVEFIPVHARAFHTIRVKPGAGEDPTQAALAEIALRTNSIPDSIMRVIVELSAEQAERLDERAIQKAAGSASHLTIQREVQEASRARLGDIGAESLSPLELLDRFFRAKNVDDPHLAELMETARTIIDSDGPPTE